MNRQLIRNWLEQGQPVTDVDEERLKRASESADWELQMTAVFAAARRQIIKLRPTLKQISLPRTSREGLDVIDRKILMAFRKALLQVIMGQKVPVKLDDLGGDASLQHHIYQCAAGLTTEQHDRVWWWANTLTTPLQLSLPLSPLPNGIVVGSDGVFRLALTEIELVWVGPDQYVLGDERSDELRLVKETEGFFIARRPVAPDYSQPETPVRLSWAEASELSRKIRDIEQLSVTFPTADEWEMAARGNDGRRFPWGNGYEREMMAQPAPCGALLMVGKAPQWTRSAASSEAKLTCGHADNLHSSLRRPLDLATGKAAFRPIIYSNFSQTPIEL